LALALEDGSGAGDEQGDVLSATVA
jgi:hypothetical protein